MYIRCEGDFATLFLDDSTKVHEIKTLKTFEKELCGMGFIRISRNTIINGKYITKIDTNCGKRVVYLGDIVLTVSKGRLRFLRQCLY
jgi:DNA-binding LytR/AlgR family response regulator